MCRTVPDGAPLPSRRRPNDEETGYGAAAAIATFLLWGLLPVYWKLLSHVNPLEVVCHRGIWSFISVLPVVLLTGRLPEVLAALRGRSLLLLGASTALLAANWLIFIWAVTNGRILETSLGNFVNPLFNMLCGVIFFQDRISRPQWLSVFLAAFAIAIRVAALGYFPWVALTLCSTFACYGMVRKIVTVESLPGLMVENIIFTPFALAALFWISHDTQLSFGADVATTALLIGAGVCTSVPTILFGYAARHLHLTTLGIFHYIVPSCSFLLGVFVYHEPFSRMNMATFAIIWLALIIYTAEKIRTRRPPILGRSKLRS